MTTTKTAPYRVLTAESNTREWLLARQSGVGASESAAILGDSAWGTAFTIYQQKIADDVVDSTTDLMEFGHLAEPVIVAFIEAHPERFGWMGDILPADGLFQSIEHPFLLASLDRWVVTPTGERVPLELKSINDFQVADWKVGDDSQSGIIPQSGGRTRYEVPRKYQVQIQQQIAVTGTPFGFVAVWLGKGQLEVIRVERDEAFIDDMLIGRVGDFWTFNVEARYPPPPTLNDDLWAALPGDSTLEAVDADGDLIDLIGQWRINTTDYRELEKVIDQNKFDIALKMGDHEAARDPLTGKVIHTLKSQNGRRIPDLLLLEAKYPDAYTECVPPPKRHRVHRATKAEI